MTLTEIIAGLVVLAVLVSSVTIARGRFARQWADAQRDLAATRAVDRMLSAWLPGGIEGDAIPVPAGGMLEGEEGCEWRTSWVGIDDGQVRSLGAGIVRLEVFRAGRALLSVDLLKTREGRR